MNVLLHQGSSERELLVPSDEEAEQCANDMEIPSWVFACLGVMGILPAHFPAPASGL